MRRERGELERKGNGYKFPYAKEGGKSSIANKASGIALTGYIATRDNEKGGGKGGAGVSERGMAAIERGGEGGEGRFIQEGKGGEKNVDLRRRWPFWGKKGGGAPLHPTEREKSRTEPCTAKANGEKEGM